MYDFGFRWYDPNLQRWINEDPLGERFDKNLFRFVYNNPVKFVDPNGLWGVDFGDWDFSWGDPTFAFDWDSWTDAKQGAYATIDGFLPLIDPFAKAGYYNPCDKWLKGSQFIGALWRDASFAAIGGSVIKSVGGASAYSQLSFTEKCFLKRLWIGELVNSSVSPGYNLLYTGAGFVIQGVNVWDIYLNIENLLQPEEQQ